MTRSSTNGLRSRTCTTEDSLLALVSSKVSCLISTIFICGGRDELTSNPFIECYQISEDHWTILSIKLELLFFNCRCFNVSPQAILIIGYREQSQSLELTSLDVSKLSFETIPNAIKNCTSLQNVGIHESDLYFFESRSYNKRFTFDKLRWTDLPAPIGLNWFDNDNFHVNFTDNFSFESIIYGKKMEQNTDRLRQYRDESYIRIEREFNSLSFSNFFGANALEPNEIDDDDWINEPFEE